MIIKSYPAPTDMAAKAAELQAQGVTIDPTATSGEIKSHGCDFTYEITDGKIVVTEKSKPWAIPDHMVWDKIDAFFAEPA